MKPTSRILGAIVNFVQKLCKKGLPSTVLVKHNFEQNFIILSILGGGYISLFPVILADYIGVKRMPQGFGITVMFIGLTNMGVPTMLGTVCN